MAIAVGKRYLSHSSRHVTKGAVPLLCHTHYTFNGKRFAYDHLDALGYAAYDESEEEE